MLNSVDNCTPLFKFTGRGAVYPYNLTPALTPGKINFFSKTLLPAPSPFYEEFGFSVEVCSQCYAAKIDA